MTNHETLTAMQRWDYKTVVLTGGFRRLPCLRRRGSEAHTALRLVVVALLHRFD
jgi:hypothetical protein